jgi:hypothetical protein
VKQEEVVRKLAIPLDPGRIALAQAALEMMGPKATDIQLERCMNRLARLAYSYGAERAERFKVAETFRADAVETVREDIKKTGRGQVGFKVKAGGEYGPEDRGDGFGIQWVRTDHLNTWMGKEVYEKAKALIGQGEVLVTKVYEDTPGTKSEFSVVIVDVVKVGKPRADAAEGAIPAERAAPEPVPVSAPPRASAAEGAAASRGSGQRDAAPKQASAPSAADDEPLPEEPPLEPSEEYPTGRWNAPAEPVRPPTPAEIEAEKARELRHDVAMATLRGENPDAQREPLTTVPASPPLPPVPVPAPAAAQARSGTDDDPWGGDPPGIPRVHWSKAAADMFGKPTDTPAHRQQLFNITVTIRNRLGWSEERLHLAGELWFAINKGYSLAGDDGNLTFNKIRTVQDAQEFYQTLVDWNAALRKAKAS